MYFECYHPTHIGYWKIWRPFYLLLSHLNNSHFSIHMLTLPSPAIVHTRFNDNWLFISFFYYCHYYFSLFFFYLVLLFIKWLYKDLLNFSFCKYISSHPTSIFSKLVLLTWALLFTLSVSLNKFLLVEIPGTKHLTYLVIVDSTFKTCLCACYKKRWRHKATSN